MAVARNLGEALRSIAEAGASRGFQVELVDDKIVVIKSKECPLRVTVEPKNGGYRIVMSVDDGLRECIGDMLQEDIDPREELENIIESLVSVIDFAVRKLESLGVKVERSTREAILDVYDSIESFLEEEE